MTDRKKPKRLDSTTSIGFPDVGPVKKKPVKSPEKKKEIAGQEAEELATDSFNYLIHCMAHKKICMSKVSAKSFWLPSFAIRPNDSWTKKTEDFLKKLGLTPEDYLKPIVINTFRIRLDQSPTQTSTSNFLTRMTFYVQLRDLEGECCKKNSKYHWIAINSVDKTQFWGPEVSLWVKYYIGKGNVKVDQFTENDATDALKDYCDRLDSCNRKEQFLVKSACFAKKDILKLFDTFVQHCYPSQFMNSLSFKQFLKRINIKIPDKDMANTFRAFDHRRRNYLTFNELLLGFAAMDQATEHGGHSGPLRCKYIFRYYDTNCDGFLTQADISRMITDIRKKTNLHSGNLRVEDQSRKLINRYGSHQRMSSDQLFQSVSEMAFRGTSHLFRAPGMTVTKHSTDKRGGEGQTSALVRHNQYDIPCEMCRQRQYKISKNIFYMTRSGEIPHFIALTNAFDNISDSGLNTEFDGNIELAKDIINKINRLYLTKWPHTQTEANQLSPEERQSLPNWFYSSKALLNRKLIELCQKSIPMFENEERVLKVSTPCYIFGDIHGNFKDLMTFSNSFWRSSPYFNQCNYLFLGDYVDRGDFGVECCAYLLALKLMAPKKFFLCRGNHEVRSLQEVFTFLTECVEKYSDNVWMAFNEVFDRLPIAAIVDHKLFCCHGGIPRSALSIDELLSVPKVLPDPVVLNPVWEILWNDPMSDEEFRALAEFERKEVENDNGFTHNVKRGTGFFYTEIAVDRFLKHNDLQYVIRGHECIQNGYKFLMNGKVTTLFSTSLYCGMRNEAAVLYANQSKIRVIRVETFQ